MTWVNWPAHLVQPSNSVQNAVLFGSGGRAGGGKVAIRYLRASTTNNQSIEAAPGFGGCPENHPDVCISYFDLAPTGDYSYCRGPMKT